MNDDELELMLVTAESYDAREPETASEVILRCELLGLIDLSDRLTELRNAISAQILGAMETIDYVRDAFSNDTIEADAKR